MSDTHSNPLRLDSVPSVSRLSDTNEEEHQGERKNADCPQKIPLFFALICCCVLGIGLGAGIYAFAHHLHSTTASNAIDSYVLPQDHVKVTHINGTLIRGVFTVNTPQGQIEFKFLSDQASQRISFDAINPDLLVNVVYKGFEMNAEATRLHFVLFLTKGGMNVPIELSNSTHLNSTGQTMLQEFVDSIVASYFVELSVKLGVWGYTGANSSAARAIHHLAKMFAKKAILPVSRLSNETVFRANQVVNATKKLGHSPTSVEEIVKYSSGGDRRRLFTVCSCTLSNQCGNPCFGMCGRDCSCWAWVCGGCGCFPECQQHDWYCSCKSSWHFWCVNVFWVGCGCAEW